MSETLAIVLVVAIGLILLLKCLINKKPEIWPYTLRKNIISRPEQVLYHRLIEALPSYIVLAQVQVSRVITVSKGAKFHRWNNKINRMSYDFVVCTMDGVAIAAIELDDKIHEKKNRKNADYRKNKATKDAGLRLLRIPVKAIPNAQEIRQLILLS